MNPTGNRSSPAYVYAGLFLACVLVAGYLAVTKEPSILPAIIVIAGAVVVIVLYLATRPGKGEITIDPKKSLTVKWEVRSDQPIRTVFPDRPSDSTTNQEAISLANEGRALIKAKGHGHEVNLSTALTKFEQAAHLDDNYWEPRINIIQILLLTGHLKDAFTEAHAVRAKFGDIPLAFAKSGLLIARVMEQGLSDDDPETKRQSTYKTIANVLQDNLHHCSGHVTTMISLGRALLLAGASANDMHDFLSGSFQYPDFVTAFKQALEREQLLDQFNRQFPGFFGQ